MQNSENSWYVVVQSKANGPHPAELIREQLKTGKLSYADLAFRAGLSRWVPLSECKEFERRIETDFATKTAFKLDVPMEQNLPGWVLLVKHAKVEGKNHYIQSGPFSADQIREKLAKSEADYEDHIWKQGFENWTPIGKLEEFDRRRPKIFETQPKPGISSTAESTSPLVQKSESVSLEEERTVVAVQAIIPKEEAITGNNDATMVMILPKQLKIEAPLVAVDKPDTVAITKEKFESEEVDKTIVHLVKAQNQEPTPIPDMKPEGPADGTIIRRARSQKLTIAAVGSLLGMALTYAGVSAYRQSLPQTTVEKFSKKATMSAPVAAVPVNPEIEDRPVKKPETLKIFSLKGASGTPQVGLETDLPPGTQINLHVWADTGSILKYPSFSLLRTIEVKAGQLPVIDLTSEKLPPGTYHLQAFHEQLQGNTTLIVGSQDENFRKKLTYFKKQIEKQQRSEKEALRDGVRFSSQTISLFNKGTLNLKLDEPNLKWAKSLKIWELNYKQQADVLKNVSELKRNSFVFPEQLLKLRTLELNLHQLAKNYYYSQKNKRQIASDQDTLPKLKADLKDLQDSLRTLR